MLGGVTTMAGSLPLFSAPLRHKAALSYQRKFWRTGSFWSIPPPINCSRNSCLSWTSGGRIHRCYCVKSWNWLLLAAIYNSSLPLEIASLQYTLESPNSYIIQILPVQLLSRWRHRFLVFLTLQSSSKKTNAFYHKRSFAFRGIMFTANFLWSFYPHYGSYTIEYRFFKWKGTEDYR